MLKGLVDPSKALSQTELSHIEELQDEIDEIWNRRGDYHIDPDAWEQMPIFMENISEEDLVKNGNCAALSSIVYDEMPPDEIAENRKEHGNRALRLALNPTQEKRENLARAACHSYTEALQAKGKDPVLTSTIYANRSLAQFIIGNYGHGLEDAQRSIILNPGYTKAFFRGAKCAERLAKYDLALNLIGKGREVLPSPTDTTLQEFDELEKLCRSRKEVAQSKERLSSRKNRVKAANANNMARVITSAGIRLSAQPEVSSEQMGMYGNPKPYLDTDGVLHVPILLIYEEYDQTDMMQDVACDVCVAELLEELMPFPWDHRGLYHAMDDIVVCYKIDDGIKDAEYYQVNMEWPLMEVMRCETYVMPMMLPVLHVFSRKSKALEKYNVHLL